MGKYRRKKQKQKNQRWEQVEDRIKSKKPRYEPKSIILDQELKKLKEEIDLRTLTKVEEIVDRWSEDVLEFSPHQINRDALVPTDPCGGPSDIYLSDWDNFISEMWDAIALVHLDETRLQYFLQYVNSNSEGAWQEANDTKEPMPNRYLLPTGPADDIYEALLGDDRVSFIWHDQLRWAAEFLKVPMP